jgi:predicted transcriptional regulator
MQKSNMAAKKGLTRAKKPICVKLSKYYETLEILAMDEFSRTFTPPKKGFFMCSNLISELPISNASVRVLLFMRGQKSNFKISVYNMIDRIYMSKPTLYRALEELVEIGILRIEKENGHCPIYYHAPDDIYEKIIEEFRSNERTEIMYSGKESLPVKKLYRSKNFTGGGKEILPPIDTGVKKLYRGGSKNFTPNNTKDNNKKTDNKNKTKIKNAPHSNISLPGKEKKPKKYSFEAHHLDLAQKWRDHYMIICPWLGDPENKLEQWANELRLISQQYNLSEEGVSKIFRFVQSDEFWRDKADSPMTLRKKNSAGVPKIVNIIKSIPEMRREIAQRSMAVKTENQKQNEKSAEGMF